MYCFGTLSENFNIYKGVIWIFAKVPREIIYNKKLHNKRVLCFIFLVYKISLDNTISFSLDSIIKWTGLKKSKNKGKSNDIFYNLILNYKQLDFISNFKSEELYGNNLITANINTDKIFPIGNYGIISDEEFQLIKTYKSNNPRINTSSLLLILAYIRVNILKRVDSNCGFTKAEIKEKPEFCYRMFVDIEKDIGIDKKTISKCVDILVGLDILATMEMPRYQDEKGNWHTEATLFANKYKYDSDSKLIEDYSCEEELKYGKQYLMNKKYISKKFYQNTEVD